MNYINTSQPDVTPAYKSFPFIVKIKDAIIRIHHLPGMNINLPIPVFYRGIMFV